MWLDWLYIGDLTLLLSEVVFGSKCRILPGDAAWPGDTDWSIFNHSVDGRLIKTVPIGAPCHTSAFNGDECELVRKNWRKPAFHERSPSSVMDPIFLNKSCDPFTAPDDQCVIGSYVEYVVNVSSTQHVIKTLKFIKKNNIRFVIKNTGHDYMGRSTGAGALSVWMHHLQDITFLDNFTSAAYTGPAFKVGAGVLGEQLTAAADKRGLATVSGACPTVGVAGGFLQGGGHSALSSMYGLGADQALAYEVITPKGDFLTASPTENEDLYWALSGGGGGTYGIVWSVTVKAHRDVPITVASLAFSPEGISRESYWKGIRAYQSITPRFTDAKAYTVAMLSNAGFMMNPMFAPNLTVNQVKALLEPLLTTLDSLDIKYASSFNTFPGYQKAFQSVAALQNVEVANFQMANRLLPRTLWESNSTFTALMDTLRSITDEGGLMLDIAVRPTLEAAGYPNNAVLPAWRNAERTLGVMLPLDDRQSLASMAKDQETVTWTFAEPLRKLTPLSGSYLNEASPIEPDFKQAFYGTNYGRLLAIKDKWDPDEVLYGRIAVGGDRWQEMSNGKLCRRSFMDRIQSYLPLGKIRHSARVEF